MSTLKRKRDMDKRELQYMKLNTSTEEDKGDLLILCPLKAGEVATCAFKVRASRLAASSTFFENLLQDATAGEEIDGLPFIEVEERRTVMGYLLAVVCNVPSPAYVIRPETAGKSLLVEIWEASNKFEMYAVRTQASVGLQVHFRTGFDSDKTLCRLLSRAEMFEDDILTGALLEGLAYKNLRTITKEQLSQVSPTSLCALLEARQLRTAVTLERISDDFEQLLDADPDMLMTQPIVTLEQVEEARLRNLRHGVLQKLRALTDELTETLAQS